MDRALSLFAFASLLPSAAMCQSAPAEKPRFDIADVHVSPRSEWVKSQLNQMEGAYLAGDRYEVRRATMLDLIRIAYNVDAEKVYGGPSWLDYDRFEIVAKTKPGTKAETLRLMLQTLLDERFHLAVRTDTRPAPAFLLMKGSGELKLKDASGSAGPGGCQMTRPEFDAGVVQYTLQCRNVTMDSFAQTLRPRLANGSRNLPVVNMTGLEGGWDIDLPLRSQTAGRGGVVNANANLLQAVEKTGLKIEEGTAPQPVLAVMQVNQRPSPNPPDVATSLPPLPAPEFEVASVKPCTDTATIALRFEPGGRVTATCMPVVSLIEQPGICPPRLIRLPARRSQCWVVHPTPTSASWPKRPLVSRPILHTMRRPAMS